MIGAKLFAENEHAYWFSFNYLNCVPMYSAFNKIFYNEMETQFLTFAQEVTSAGDMVCLKVSVSPNTRYDIQTRLGITTEDSWLGEGREQINIPRSVSVIAFSLPNMGRVGKWFAFVGNNDEFSPEWYFPKDLLELEDYCSEGGDFASLWDIRLLKINGYEMWHPN